MGAYTKQVRGTEAYRTGGFVLLAAIGVILVALGFEHIGGFQPCELCLLQRWAYYFSIPAAFVALALASAGSPRAAALVFFVVALAFLANAGVGVYQAGAEWKFWAGPATCTGQQPVATSAGGLLDSLKSTNVVRCDEPQIRILGLSFAGWNVLASLMLFGAGIKAAFASAEQR